MLLKPHQMRMKIHDPSLTLTLSHQGAREIEIWDNKIVPSPLMGEGEDEGEFIIVADYSLLVTVFSG